MNRITVIVSGAAVLLLQTALASSRRAETTPVTLPSERDVEHDLKLWFDDVDCVAVLCEFTHGEGISTYVFMERLTSSEYPPYMRRALKSTEMSFKIGIEH